MPPEDCSHDRGHKFPFITNELISTKLDTFTDKFFALEEEKKEEEFSTIEGSDD
jgi:hypothetical protein